VIAIACPAHAEFYKLEGRYECLAKPGAVCYDATPLPSLELPAKHGAAPAQDEDSAAPLSAASPADRSGVRKDRDGPPQGAGCRSHA